MWATELTRRFGLAHGIVCPPMHAAGGPALVAAVARSGGLAFLPAGFISVEQTEREFQETVDLLGGSKERVGIGLVNYRGDIAEKIEVACQLRPAAIWLAFGDFQPHGETIREAGIKVVAQISSTEEAAQVARFADAVVAQGAESGGHGSRSAPPVFSLVPEVADVCAAAAGAGQTPIPVIAAGGIADARQVAAALMLGAAGAVMGTRLVVTHESLFPAEKLELYLAASDASAAAPGTLRTQLYDQLGPREWPTSIDGRLLANNFTDLHGTRPRLQADEKEQLRRELQQAGSQAQPAWAGSSVGLIHDVQHAEPLVKQIAQDAARIIQAKARLLQESGA